MEPSRRLCPNVFGHGPIPPTSKKTTFDEECERLCALVTEPIHLVAYSMGARLGLGMLLCAPDRFKSAVLVGVHPGLQDEAMRESRAHEEAGWKERLERDGLDGFVEWWEARPLFDSQQMLDDDVRTRQYSIRTSHFAEPVASAIDALGLAAMPSFHRRFADITTPTLLMTGAWDEKFARLAAEVAPALRHGENTIIEGAGHNVILEQPDAAWQTIAAFQKRVSAQQKVPAK